MKRGIIGLFVACALLLFYACMSEEDGLVTYHRMGVVENSSGKSIYTEDDSGYVYRITAPAIESDEQLTAGDCVMVDYTTNYKKQQEGGIYQVDLIGCLKLNAWPLLSQLTDTLSVLPHESIFSLQFGRTQYLNGHLFITTEHSIYQSDETERFEISYDPKQSVLTDEEGHRFYTLYLRMTRQAGVTDTVSWIDVKSFDFASFVTEHSLAESAAGSTALRFQLRYVTGFNSDTTACEWASTALFAIDLKQ